MNGDPQSAACSRQPSIPTTSRWHSFYGGFLGLECVLDTPRMLTYAVAPAQVLLVFKRGATREDIETPEGLIPVDHSEVPGTLPLPSLPATTPPGRPICRRRAVALRSETTWGRGGKSLYFDDPDGNVVELPRPDCGDY